METNEAIKTLKDHKICFEHDFGWNRTVLEALDFAIQSLAAADVMPVRHGRWIWNPNGMDWGIGAWCCSECGSKAETWWANDSRYNPLHCSGGHFCGNCGAKMDLVTDRNQVKGGDGE